MTHDTLIDMPLSKVLGLGLVGSVYATERRHLRCTTGRFKQAS